MPSTAISRVSEVNSQSQVYDGSVHVDNEHLFSGKLENLKNVIRILKSIQIREFAHFHITPKGIRVILQELGNFQATAYLQKELFQQFDCKNPEVVFKVSLKVLLECLQLFVGVSVTTGQFFYKGTGQPLSVMLEEMGYYSECRIKTVTMDGPLVDMEFLAEDLLCRIIVKSECISDSFQDLLSFQVGSFEVAISQNAPYVFFQTKSDNVTSEVTISRDSEFVETFYCKSDHTFRYRSALIKAALKPLHISEKTSIRIDSRGVLALQFMVRNEDDITSFVELYCSPEQEIEDEE